MSGGQNYRFIVPILQGRVHWERKSCSTNASAQTVGPCGSRSATHLAPGSASGSTPTRHALLLSPLFAVPGTDTDN